MFANWDQGAASQTDSTDFSPNWIFISRAAIDGRMMKEETVTGVTRHAENAASIGPSKKVVGLLGGFEGWEIIVMSLNNWPVSSFVSVFQHLNPTWQVWHITWHWHVRSSLEKICFVLFLRISQEAVKVFGSAEKCCRAVWGRPAVEYSYCVFVFGWGIILRYRIAKFACIFFKLPSVKPKEAGQPK